LSYRVQYCADQNLVIRKIIKGHPVKGLRELTAYSIDLSSSDKWRFTYAIL